MREIMLKMCDLSDDSLSLELSSAIKGFYAKNPVASVDDQQKFLSELRDWIVYTSGASSFVMILIASFIGDERSYPPPDCGYEAWLAR